MIKAALVEARTGRLITTLSETATLSESQTLPGLRGDEIALLVESVDSAHGTFQSATITTATTTAVASPNSNGSLIITDIVIGAKKVNNTTLTVQFTDGVDTAVVIAPDTINEPVNFSWSIRGRIHGWKDARIDVVTGGAGTPSVTIMVGYVKVPTGQPFAEWDALR